MTQTDNISAIPLLSAVSQAEFLDKARRMGHETAALLAGEEVTTFFTLDSFDAARVMVSNATPIERKLRQAVFFNTSLMSRSKLGQGRHDRGEAVIFAGCPISDQDAKGIDRHFPVHVKAVSVLHKTIRRGQTWDVSVPTSYWGLDDREDLYMLLNVGTLVLEEGAKMVIRGNVFSFLCQQLICEGRPLPGGYQIGILPTPFSVDFGHGPHNGVHGSHGGSGMDGTNGLSPTINYGILGAHIAENEQATLLNGTNGTDGEHGLDGTKGRNGGMCKLAELTIRDLAGYLVVFSQAGKGGNGGHGGNGGDGGKGGHAAAGVRAFNAFVPGGKGGDGGKGGNGARGGNAGHGGIASNIYLRVPPAAFSHIKMISLAAQGGDGGNGGAAGAGGAKGLAQQTENNTLQGINGKEGQSGQAGKAGLNGRERPAAVLYLNDIIYH